MSGRGILFYERAIMHKQKGSILVVALVAVILSAAVAGAGYFVYNNQLTRNKVDTAEQSENATTEKSAKDQAEDQPFSTNTSNPTSLVQTNNQSNSAEFLIIKEWGVKIPLTDQTRTATYRLVDETDNTGKTITKNRSVFLVVPFTDNSGCNEQAAISRYAPNENPPEYLASDTWDDSAPIGGYYYLMSFSQSACVEDFETNPIQVQASAIRKAWSDQNGKITVL